MTIPNGIRPRQTSTTPSVRISRTLMQDYRTETPATDVHDIALAWLDDELMIFTIDSQHVLHRLFRSPSSSSGWSSEAIDTDIWSIAVHEDAATGSDRVFCQGSSFYEVKRTSKGAYKTHSLAMAIGGSIVTASCDGAPLICSCVPSEPGQTFRPPAGGYCLASDTLFILVGAESTHAGKAVCVDAPGNMWPRLPFVLLENKRLRACRGTRLTTDQPLAAGTPGSALDYRQINVEFSPLPALADVRDFVTVTDTDGNPQLIAVDGSARLHFISGIADPATPGLIDWQAGWSSLFLTGSATPAFSKLHAINVNGRQQVVACDAATGHLWITACIDGGWSTAIDLGVPGQFVSLNVNTAGAVELAASGGERLMLVSRDRADDWRSEEVFLPSSEKIEMLLTYRSSLNLVGDFNTVAATNDVNVFATDEVAAAVGLSQQVLRPERSIATKSDGHGRVTITSELRDSLYAPAVAFQGGFSGRGYFEIRPDADVQAFLKSVTPGQLLAGRDPLTGSEILPGTFHTQEDAEAVAATLARIGDFIDNEYAPEAASNAPFAFAPVRGVRFVDGPYQGARAFRPKPAGTAWHFNVRDGRAGFRTLTPGQAAEAMAAARALEGPRFRIDLGSLLRSAARGLAKISDVIVDGVDAAITFTLNGVAQALTFAIDSLERAFDAVSTVFEMVGIDLEVVVGWLAAVIGFLFDWDAIKAARDRAKQSFRDNAAQVPLRTADPMNLLAPYTNALETLPASIDGMIAQLRADPIGANPFSSVSGELPPVPDLSTLFSSGAVLLEPAMWLVEKGVGALTGLIGSFGLPDIPGFAEIIATLTAKVEAAAAQILSLMDDLWQHELMSWVVNLAAFEAGTIVDILEFVQRAVQSVVDLLMSLVEAMLQMLHLAWASPLLVVEWLDAKITVPFLSTFYREVLGNDLSVLDLACLGLGLTTVFLADNSMETDALMSGLVLWTILMLGGELVSLPRPIGAADWPRILASILQLLLGTGLLMLENPGWNAIAPTVIGSAFFNIVMASGIVIGPMESMFVAAALFELLTELTRIAGAPVVPKVVLALFATSNILGSSIRALPPAQRLPLANPYLALQAAVALSIDVICFVTWNTSDKVRLPGQIPRLGPAPV